jgi:hypothetical protein
LLIPMVIFANHELPVVAATYMLTGRFSPQREFESHPETLDAGKIQPAKFENAPAARLLAIETQEREDVVGASKEWNAYRREFDFMVNEAVREEIIPAREYLDHFLERLEQAGRPYTDAKGALWLEVSNGHETSTVGVSVSNILARRSDSGLAFPLLLARIDRVLKSPKHSRETMLEFKQDWSLLQHARAKILVTNTAALSPASDATTRVADGDE